MRALQKSWAAAALLLTVAVLAATPLEGRWTIDVGEDPGSFEVLASLRQDAANTIKDEYAAQDVTPQLLLRCAPGNPEVRAAIDWRRFISSFNTEVGFKVDAGSTLWLKWGVDRSNRVTLSPSADDTAKLLEALHAGKTLAVEVAPYSEAPVTVEFDLTGLAGGLARLAEECG